MKAFTIAKTFAVVACLSSTAATAADQILTFTGLGPVRIGMTVAQAERALGAKLKPLDPRDGASTDACWYSRRADGTDQLVAYMISDGKIVRIDIEDHVPGQAEFSVPPIATERGVRIGHSEEDVKKQYGSNLIVSPHPNGGEKDHYLMVLGKDGKTGILFESWGGKINTFRAGTAEAIELSEGCS